MGVPPGLTQDNYPLQGTIELHTTIGDFVVPLYRLENFIDQGTEILRNNRTFTQTYDSLDLMLEKAMAQKFFFSGRLVLQRQRAHHLSKEFPPWHFFPLNYFFMDPQWNYSFRENKLYGFLAKGPGTSEFPAPEWQLKFGGSYRLPWRMGLGAFLRYQQGRPFTLNGNCIGCYTFPFAVFFNVEPLGKRTLDNVFTLDLKVDKEIRLRSSRSLDLILEIMNATNSNPILQRGGGLGRVENFVYKPNPNLNRAFQYLSPRVLRLGLRYSF